MKRSLFLLISAIGSLGFGAMMFFAPTLAAELLGLDLTPTSVSLLHGMGGLIIGSGVMNLLFRNAQERTMIRALLITNIVTHAFGLSADVWGVLDSALQIGKMAPVEITHLFVGGGSLVYLLGLNKSIGK